ncbi:ABC transporter ATP-binding protein [Butyrivibrio sp. MC2013]|uniref:ABC transporter ATP-binding protein n=1 Tax=Butyrivibrio sp. MC2013 TaxID=1280686 RepID=UPI00040657D1|nr:ABC transporter ATP-binding protein [Butyrivibrio sp. MC2013]
MDTNAIELKGVTKRFGNVIANDHVDLTLKKGEILSILGENGSGKTTLMNMLSGIYFPDEGQIMVNGESVTIRNPMDSFELGIGMIHQHFKLINILTAAENIILGQIGQGRRDMKKVNKEVKDLIDRYGFELSPTEKIYNMSVSQKQTVEIIKVLYRGADILILDEPTAVLTPQEIEKLFDVLRRMKKAGKSIIIITHKLNEVLEISDRVAVLRKGSCIGTVETSQTNAQQLTEMMVGEKVHLDIKRTDPVGCEKRIDVRGVSVRDSEGLFILKDVSFEANSGEILGIAGISGSGQKELLESIAGLQNIDSGEILYYPPGDAPVEKLSEKSVQEIQNLKISLSFVPEDRLGMGLVASMDLTDNMMIRSYRSGKSKFFTDRKSPKKLAEKIVDKLEVKTPGVETPVSKLSGGNVQKILVGREIATNPNVLMVAYPVRGLDINSSYTIYNLLADQKSKGVAVMCVGEDLDVLLQLCDRIMVLCEGSVTGIVNAKESSKEELGMLMTGGRKVERSV